MRTETETTQTSGVNLRFYMPRLTEPELEYLLNLAARCLCDSAPRLGAWVVDVVQREMGRRVSEDSESTLPCFPVTEFTNADVAAALVAMMAMRRVVKQDECIAAAYDFLQRVDQLITNVAYVRLRAAV